MASTIIYECPECGCIQSVAGFEVVDCERCRYLFSPARTTEPLKGQVAPIAIEHYSRMPAIRLMCWECETETFDEIPPGWTEIKEDDSQGIWWTHGGLCPECSIANRNGFKGVEPAPGQRELFPSHESPTGE